MTQNSQPLVLIQARCVVLKKQYADVQVPLLLSLGEMEGALTKAIDSGDTDLVYLAIFRLVTTLTYTAC